MAGFQASASSQGSEERGTERTASSCEYTDCQSIKTLRKEMCIVCPQKFATNGLCVNAQILETINNH